jgi:large subunit ribosomal protein L4
VAEIVKLEELAELGLDKPNLLHIQESYLRQVAHSKPFTAKKKTKGEVAMTTAKWFRQKGTGRARQGAKSNPHMHGGGRAFPPRPHLKTMKLNKHVRQSALRSAVLWHIQDASAFVIRGGDFDTFAKTREVAALLSGITGGASCCLVLKRDVLAWRSSRNIWGLRLLSPEQINVRDLMDSHFLLFTEAALADYRTLLMRNLVTLTEAEAESPAAGGEA